LKRRPDTYRIKQMEGLGLDLEFDLTSTRVLILKEREEFIKKSGR
jgi:hypothetical protein